MCNNFNDTLTYLILFSFKSCEYVISYIFVLLEVVRKLSPFCKLTRRSKALGQPCFMTF